MFSYWEKQALFHFDAAVIGSGITGLSTAISLAEKRPRWKIAVLERGIIPAGASTRNAGFACIGSFTEILDDLAHMPEQKVLSLVKMRRDGLRLLRDRLGDDAIGYRENGSYELIGETQLSLLDRLDAVNQMLREALPGAAFSLCQKKIKSFGFAENKIKGMLQNHFEGELDTGRMMNALIEKALGLGIRLFNGCPVVRLEEQAGDVTILARSAVNDEPLCFRAGVTAVCTNAFTRALLPEVALHPGRGQVLITEPIKNIPFKGIFHFDRGYYYFREINGRILLGGGRNLDFDGEKTTEPGLTDQIQQDLEEKLRQIILPGRTPAIASRWAGIMAFGDEKYPLIERCSPRVFMGVRLGGMGVAIGSEVGRSLAEKITGEK